ncbi:MAG: carbohydrate ABC transporter permease [Firmicutes bacterium]|mgnify:CR=1 FL=1|jgi:ABC-type glycerol-3-phosphate transport system permease component|nr:carbohydrate ABC transporter permease [Bacillota bacterium]
MLVSIRKMQLPIHIILIAFLLMIFVPVLEMVNISFKSDTQFDHNPWGVEAPFQTENYVAVWPMISGYLLNTVIYAVSIALGTVFLACISAFVFARFDFPGRDFLYLMVISLLMVPPAVTLIPQFVLVRNLGLLGTRWAMILPMVAGGQVFGIFLLKAFFEGLPEELFEAARVDGADSIRCFFYIGLPLSKPIIGTLVVINILGTWNNIIWPRVVLSDDGLFPLTVGLMQFRQLFYTVWGPLMAGYVIASIPLIVLFALASRLFVQGLTSGALKV